jgi:hypothetical protein
MHCDFTRVWVSSPTHILGTLPASDRKTVEDLINQIKDSKSDICHDPDAAIKKTDDLISEFSKNSAATFYYSHQLADVFALKQMCDHPDDKSVRAFLSSLKHDDDQVCEIAFSRYSDDFSRSGNAWVASATDKNACGAVQVHQFVKEESKEIPGAYVWTYYINTVVPPSASCPSSGSEKYVAWEVRDHNYFRECKVIRFGPGLGDYQ